MRARIMKKESELVLTYGISDEISVKLSAVLQDLFLQQREIKPEEGGQQLGFLAGYPGFTSSQGTEEIIITEGVMCMSGLSSSRIDTLLRILREEKISVPLKAVVTPINQRWTFARLVTELDRERREIARQAAAKKR